MPFEIGSLGKRLDAVRIGGGLLVAASGWRWAIYPLTFPLTRGPGSISVALTLGTGFRILRAN